MAWNVELYYEIFLSFSHYIPSRSTDLFLFLRLAPKKKKKNEPCFTQN